MVRLIQIANIVFDLTHYGLGKAIAASGSLVLSLYIAYKWDGIRAHMIRIETERKRKQEQALNKDQNSLAESEAKKAEDKINEVLNGRT